MSFQKNKISSRSYSKNTPYERLRKRTNRYGIDDNNNGNYDHLLGKFDEENEAKNCSFTNAAEDTQNSDNSDEIHLLPIIVEMRAIIKLLTEKLNGLSTEVRDMQQNSVLNIGQNEVEEQELPQLKMFESFKLPIDERHDLEKLETHLKTDESFHIFFINRLVPIVRNLYQTRRLILWGFTLSLISKDLLAKYTWSHRQENKHCFENMKMIQSVLWCAMVKVSPTYSVQEFENDFKNNLSKCAAQMKTKFE